MIWKNEDEEFEDPHSKVMSEENEESEESEESEEQVESEEYSMHHISS